MAKHLIFLSGLLALAALSAVLLMAPTGSCAVPTSEPDKQQLIPKENTRAKFVMPKLIDFEAFKRMFKKHYKSLGEELNRKLNFVPRALRAMISAVRFKFGYDSSYKRVNDMSDYTSAEIEQMANKVLEESLEDETLLNAEEVHLTNELKKGGGQSLGAAATSEVQLNEGPALIEELSQEGSTAHKRSSRRKRDTSTLVWHQLKKITRAELREGSVPNPRFTYDSRLDDEERAELPDGLFTDYRQTGCLSEIGHQGYCGACYAFSIVAILEYMICRQTGRQTPLSEQYIVDCGNGRYEGRMLGCRGAKVSGVGNFVHDFGLEPAWRYPYVGFEQVCPYNLDSNPARAGRVRMDLGDAVHIHQDHWERVLEQGGPLYVHAWSYPGMLEYGGGIDRPTGCSGRTNHEMVLVGHGRENGEHYWLVRNSYGPFFGEEGYWRIAKESAALCLGQYGEAFGTTDGINFSVQPRLNED